MEKNISSRVIYIPVLLSSVLILAIARPQFKNEERLPTEKGSDIILCLDISAVCWRRILPQTEWKPQKNVASEFIDSRPTDRIGLVIFQEKVLRCVR